jgi:hypothetical protein
MEFTFDLAVRKTIGTEQDNAGAEHVSLGRSALPDNGLQPFPIARP